MNAFAKFFLGFFVIVLIGAGAVLFDAAPGSGAAAERKLAASVSAQLSDPAFDQVTASVNGQTVVLNGSVPSDAARTDAIARVAKADGPGGLFWGGVTTVDASGLTVKPPVIAAAAPEADAPPVTAPEQPADAGRSDQPDPETETPPSDSARAADIAETDPAETAEAETPETCLADLQQVIDESRIGFSSARTNIDAAAREQLRVIAAMMEDCPGVALEIIGHTDASGNAQRNLQLSQYRADAVRTFLVSLGAPKERLAARGVGAREPLASNRTPAGRARNRRIEIRVTGNP